MENLTVLHFLRVELRSAERESLKLILHQRCPEVDLERYFSGSLLAFKRQQYFEAFR